MPEDKVLGNRHFSLLNPFCIETSYMAFDDAEVTSKAMSIKGIWLNVLALLPLFGLVFFVVIKNIFILHFSLNK